MPASLTIARAGQPERPAVRQMYDPKPYHNDLSDARWDSSNPS
jgi:hypothetical protein